jgi:hypothetical protein
MYSLSELHTLPFDDYTLSFIDYNLPIATPLPSNTDTDLSPGTLHILAPCTLTALPTPLANLRRSSSSSSSSFPPPPPYEAANPYRAAGAPTLPPTSPVRSTPCRFAPPKFSERLRRVVGSRPRPLRVHLVPVSGNRRRLFVRRVGEQTAAMPRVVECGEEEANVGGGGEKRRRLVERLDSVDVRVWLVIAIVAAVGFLISAGGVAIAVWKSS